MSRFKTIALIIVGISLFTYVIVVINYNFIPYCTYQDVRYSTTTRDDNTLAKGKINVITKGRNGSRQICVHKNGDKVSDIVVTQPVDQVVSRGTYVAPATNYYQQPKRCTTIYTPGVHYYGTNTPGIASTSCQ